MPKTLFSILLLVGSVFSFSTVSDTLIEQDTLSKEYIIKKLEEIDAKLTLLLSEKIDNNPLATGSTENWGRGFNFVVRPGFFRLNIEFGYIIKPRKFRFGVFCGGQAVTGMSWRPNFLNTGIIFGSPVLMNFVSVSGNYEILYFPKPDFAGGRNSRIGHLVHFDLEIWAHPQFCFTLGNNWMLANREVSEPGALKGMFSIYDYARFGFRVLFPSKSVVKKGI